MGLHPDNTVWFPRAPGHRVTVLDVFSFQAPPACGCDPGIPWIQIAPVFLHDLQSFLEKTGQPLTLPSFCRIYKWKWSLFFSHSQNGCEDPQKTDQEELWNDNLSLCDIDITPLIHPSETRRGSCPGWQGGKALGWWAWDAGGGAERTQNWC